MSTSFGQKAPGSRCSCSEWGRQRSRGVEQGRGGLLCVAGVWAAACGCSDVVLQVIGWYKSPQEAPTQTEHLQAAGPGPGPVTGETETPQPPPPHDCNCAYHVPRPLPCRQQDRELDHLGDHVVRIGQLGKEMGQELHVQGQVRGRGTQEECREWRGWRGIILVAAGWAGAGRRSARIRGMHVPEGCSGAGAGGMRGAGRAGAA